MTILTAQLSFAQAINSSEQQESKRSLTLRYPKDRGYWFQKNGVSHIRFSWRQSGIERSKRLLRIHKDCHKNQNELVFEKEVKFSSFVWKTEEIGTFCWQILVFDQNQSEQVIFQSSVRRLLIVPDPPSVQAIYSSVDTVRFQWKTKYKADFYRFKLAQDIQFDHPIINEDLNQDFFQIQSLKPGRYFVKVGVKYSSEYPIIYSNIISLDIAERAESPKPVVKPVVNQIKKKVVSERVSFGDLNIPTFGSFRLGFPMTNDLPVISKSYLISSFLEINEGPAKGLRWSLDVAPEVKKIDRGLETHFSWYRTSVGWSMTLFDFDGSLPIIEHIDFIPRIGVMSLNSRLPFVIDQLNNIDTILFQSTNQLDLGLEIGATHQNSWFGTRIWGSVNYGGLWSGTNFKIISYRGGIDNYWTYHRRLGRWKLQPLIFAMAERIDFTTSDTWITEINQFKVKDAIVFIFFIGAGMTIF